MFYVVRNNKYYGPFTGKEIETLKSKGKINIVQGDRVVPASIIDNSTTKTIHNKPSVGVGIIDFLDFNFDRSLHLIVVKTTWALWLLAAFSITITYTIVAAYRYFMLPESNMFLLQLILSILVVSICVRLSLELIVVIFRLAEYTKRIAETRETNN